MEHLQLEQVLVVFVVREVVVVLGIQQSATSRLRLSRMVELSVVIPVYNSEGCLEALHRQLGESLRGMAHEVIYVNDQSTDASWPTLCRLCAGDPSRVGLRLRKNVGQDNAILCGLRRARGASVVVMDDDLQHAPSDIPALYARCREQDLDVC